VSKRSFFTKNFSVIAMMPGLLLPVLGFSTGLISCNKKENYEALSAYLGAVEKYQENNLAEAETLVCGALKNDKNFYQAGLLYGKILFFQDKLSKAQDVFSKLVQRTPEFTEARIWNIRTLILLKEYDKAESLLDKEISINTSDWRVYYQYALLEALRGNTENRIAVLNTGDKYLEESARLYLELAKIWYSLKMKDKSLEYLRRASAVSRDSMTEQAIARLRSEAINTEGLNGE